MSLKIRMKFSFLLKGVIVLLVSMTLGCQKTAPWFLKSSEKKISDVLPKVEQLDLAKLILKLPKTELDVTRDPFKPLTNGQFSGGDTSPVVIADLQFVGVVRSDDELLAFLEFKLKRGLFHVNDMVDIYTIEEIHEDHVVLKNGTQSITLTRKEGK